VDFLKQKTDWPGEAPAVRTMGRMVVTMGDPPVNVCQAASQKIVLVQQRSADVGKSADGLYAELWSATW
jgi:hypothetical protein